MKSILLYLLLVVGATVTAQTTHNISMGASYANSQYYNLATDATQSVAHTNWHIAFSVFGATDAGIHINEGASLGGSAAKLYEALNKSFSDNITSADYSNYELKNPESAWSDGAFNVPKSASNPGDYGWGTYQGPPSYAVTSSRVYVIVAGAMTKKITIDSMVSGTYYFSYADLDGSNLQQKSIAKSAHAGKTLAHFSLTTGNTVTAEPTTGWDWVLTRYNTPLYSTNPPTPYTVGGILTNKGVKVALADGITPSTVSHTGYTRTEDSLKIMGHDWKDFDFSQGWVVDNDRVYFVETAAGDLYKIQFIDFQGSSTGQGTFLKTSLGSAVPVQKIGDNSILQSMNVYPNPARDVVNVTYSLQEAKDDVQLIVYNILGNTVIQQQVVGNEGLNAVMLSGWNLANGQYIVTIKTDDAIATQKLLIQK